MSYITFPNQFGADAGFGGVSFGQSPIPGLPSGFPSIPGLPGGLPTTGLEQAVFINGLARVPIELQQAAVGAMEMLAFQATSSEPGRVTGSAAIVAGQSPTGWVSSLVSQGMVVMANRATVAQGGGSVAILATSDPTAVAVAAGAPAGAYVIIDGPGTVILQAEAVHKQTQPGTPPGPLPTPQPPGPGPLPTPQPAPPQPAPPAPGASTMSKWIPIAAVAAVGVIGVAFVMTRKPRRMSANWGR